MRTFFTPWIVGVVIVLILGFAGIYIFSKQAKLPSEPINDQVEDDFFSCSADADCISARADSCGCTAGGKAIAINGKFKDKWEEGNETLQFVD